MSYSLAKALHVAAGMIWLAGLFWQARRLTSTTARPGDRGLARAWRVDRFVVLPAMVVVWVLGPYLAWRGGWFAAHWIAVKLIFVVTLSGLCLAQGAELRRRARGDGRWTDGFVRLADLATVVAAGSATALAILKPF